MSKPKQQTFNRRCPECQTDFTTHDQRRMYCSRRCSNRLHTRKWYRRASQALKRQRKAKVAA